MRHDLTQRTERVLEALIANSRIPVGFVNGRDVARTLSISPHYLATVMAPPTPAAPVHSGQGPRTDECRPPHRIRRRDADRSRCVHGDLVSSVHEPWAWEREPLLEELDSENLAEVLGIQQ